MMRARVELRIDPQGLGRVKVRIPGIHGMDASIDSLPWAYILSSGGGFDSGTFTPPEVGSWVVVDKSDLEEQYYILGVIRGSGSVSLRGSFIPEEDERFKKQLVGPWKTEKTQKEVPLESQNTGEPETVTVYKSLKGATIKITDSNGNENIEIIGHDGSTIKMIAPYQENFYYGRENTRLNHDMNSPVDKSKFKTTAIIMKDSSGNIIRSMGNREGKSTVEIIGQGSQVVAGLEILPDDSKATLFISSEGSRSELGITPNSIEMTNGKSSISMTDDSVRIDCSNFTLNANNISESASSLLLKGNVTTISGSSVNISSDNANLTGSSVNVGGGSVAIGPSVALGASVSKGSVESPDTLGVKPVGSWSNNVDPAYGGTGNK